jgi:hypothetical protein
MLVCDKCNAGITEGTKFCPQCGDPVTEADRVSIPALKNQIAPVEITFGYSTSANYQKAVDICKNIPSYTESGEGKNLQHKIILPITEVELLTNLFELVGSWKTSQMLINGHACTKKDLTYYGVGCFRSKKKAYKPEQYCFGESEYEANIWGCKRLNMPINEWGGGWLSYGSFNKSGVWVFDKNRIKHEIELAIKENELCPVLDRQRILETLDKIPETINPKTDKNWKYQTSYEEIDGDYKEVAVGIKPVIKKINKYVLGSFRPSWDMSGNSSGATSNSNLPELQLEYGNEKQSKATYKPRKKKSNLKGLGWLIFIFFVLYIMLK